MLQTLSKPSAQVEKEYINQNEAEISLSYYSLYIHST